MSSRS